MTRETYSQVVKRAIERSGEAGISVKGLTEATGIETRGIKRAVRDLRDRGVPVVTKWLGGKQQVYVMGKASDAEPRKLVPGSGLFLVVQRVRDAGKQGIASALMCEGLRPGSAASIITTATRSRHIFGRRWPGARGEPFRFFASQEMLDEAYAAAEMAHAAAMARKVKARQSKGQVRGPVLDPNAPVVGDGSDIPPIAGPRHTDTRFTPAVVPKFFGNMKPGNYLQADTWAARAYGGGA